LVDFGLNKIKIRAFSPDFYFVIRIKRLRSNDKEAIHLEFKEIPGRIMQVDFDGKTSPKP
jgi:hypothetical protein